MIPSASVLSLRRTQTLPMLYRSCLKLQYAVRIIVTSSCRSYRTSITCRRFSIARTLYCFPFICLFSFFRCFPSILLPALFEKIIAQFSCYHPRYSWLCGLRRMHAHSFISIPCHVPVSLLIVCLYLTPLQNIASFFSETSAHVFVFFARHEN